MTLDSWGLNKGGWIMGKAAKKPSGFAEFDSLAKKLVAVPKEELDRHLAKKKATKKK